MCIHLSTDVEVIIDEVEGADIEMTDTEYDGDIEDMGMGIHPNHRTKRTIKNTPITLHGPAWMFV